MGAESSVLEGYEWGPPIDCPPKLPWEMFPVTKPDGTSATVFESKNADTKHVDLLRKSASTLRGLRHPNIIRFIGCGRSSDGFWLATESVLPLFTFVSDMSSQELCAGLFDLLQGLEFFAFKVLILVTVHSQLAACHNNICLSSVYVSSDGTWKIGGLEHACKFAEATQEFLEQCRAFRHEDSLSPEEKTSSVRVDSSLGYARDVFAFGALVDVVLDLVKEKDSCAQLLEQQLSVCLSPDPASRPRVSSLLNLSVFRSDLIEILKFLRHVTVKTDAEKKEFFSNLMPRLYHLPEMAIARRLVVPLLARFVLLDEWAVVHVLPHLLTPKGSSCRKSSPFVQGLLPEHLFRQYVINHIYNIFHVYDSHVRLVLLEYFSHYLSMFTRQQLEDDIFLQILLGVRDTDDRLVAASLRALADLVPVMGGDVVVGGVRKPFFFHGMPKQMSSQNLPKMNIPQNMMAILAENRPMLKNLAASSNNNVPAVERSLAEREKKAKEREQRREEARLKREERRNLLKDKQANDKQVNSVQGDGDGQTLNLIIENVGALVDEKVTLKSETEDNGNESGDIIHKLESNRKNHDEESREPDWTDWEDADQQISDEIERELQNMSIIISMEPKVQTSPSPYRSHSPPSPPPVTVDWSDVPEADRDVDKNKRGPSIREGGALYLEAQGVQKNVHINGKKTFDQNTHLESVSTTRPGLMQKSLPSLPSSIENIRLNGTATAKQHVKKAGDKRLTDDLGAGLDIKSINIIIKSTPPELDFFADMAPSITEPKSSDLVSLLESNTAESAEDKLPVSSLPLSGRTDEGKINVSSQLFAVSGISEEEVKGWGEDDDELDWGNEPSSS